MTRADWVEASIAARHDRKQFDCGEPALNAYLQRYARQNHESGGAKCFVVATQDEPDRVLGFYTLSPTEVAFANTPEVVRKGLGRYGVPAFRLGRLGVDRSGRGLGGRLLMSAGERALVVSAEVGGVALLIDAKGPRAAAWYESYGALPLIDTPLSLLLPLTTVAAIIADRTSV